MQKQLSKNRHTLTDTANHPGEACRTPSQQGYLESDFHEELGEGMLHAVDFARFGITSEKVEGERPTEIVVQSM